jgi:hypothetical protein
MRIIVIILQIISGFTLLPWFAVAGLSFMAFDSPQSIKKIVPWLFVLSVFSYPFILGTSCWWAWSNFLSKNINAALFWSCFPMIVFATGYFAITRLTNYLDNLSK